MPIGMITLAQTAGPSRVGRVMSVIGVPMLLAPVLGPVLGGLIVTHLSWRWIFLVNLPIGVDRPRARGAAHAAGRSIGRGGRTRRLDARLEGPAAPVARPRVRRVRPERGLEQRRRRRSSGCCRAIARARADRGVRRATRGTAESPLVDVRLFRGRGFAAAGATVFLVGGALFGALLVLPLYYQVGRGESRAHGRPAHGPAGRRRGARHEPRRAARRPHRRRARRRSPGSSMLMVGTIAVHPGRRRHVVLAPRRRRWSCAASASASR